MEDTRIVCGARCCWWDSIDKVGSTPATGGATLPACPHCGGVLYEYPNEAEWWASVDRYEQCSGTVGYRGLMEWLRGRCVRDLAAALKAYETATGRTVIPGNRCAR